MKKVFQLIKLFLLIGSILLVSGCSKPTKGLEYELYINDDGLENYSVVKYDDWDNGIEYIIWDYEDINWLYIMWYNNITYNF